MFVNGLVGTTSLQNAHRDPEGILRVLCSFSTPPTGASGANACGGHRLPTLEERVLWALARGNWGNKP